MKKRKRKWIKLGILCSVVVLLVLGFKIKDYSENPLWYKFKGELMKENRLITSISRNCYEGHACTIWICLKNKEINFNVVEPIFETFLKELNQREFVEELYAYFEKKGIRIATMSICFCVDKNGNSPFFYDFYIELQQDDRESFIHDMWSLTYSRPEEHLYKKYKASEYK